MNFFERNELELVEKLLLSEGGRVSEGGVNYCRARRVDPRDVEMEIFPSKVGPVQNPGGVTACDSHVLVQIFAKCGEN